MYAQQHGFVEVGVVMTFTLDRGLLVWQSRMVRAAVFCPYFEGLEVLYTVSFVVPYIHTHCWVWMPVGRSAHLQNAFQVVQIRTGAVRTVKSDFGLSLARGG